MFFRSKAFERAARGGRGLSEIDFDKNPILNPYDLPNGSYAREELFLMEASDHGFGTKRAYIWADSMEDAFEEFVEHLDEVAPGLLTKFEESDYRDAANGLGLKWKSSWPDWSDPDFEKVAEETEADHTTIGHTTLKSGATHIASYNWGGGEVTDADKYNEVWTRSAEIYEHDNEADEPLEPPKGVTRLRASKVVVARRGLKIDTSVDGLSGARRRK